MNQFRNPRLTSVLGLLMAAVVLMQMVSPAAEQVRVTTFAQWLDRSLQMELRGDKEQGQDSADHRSIEMIQLWLSDHTHESSVMDGSTTPVPNERWAVSGWILQAWNDYNEMTDGMKATLSDRVVTGSSWILQKATHTAPHPNNRSGITRSSYRSLLSDLQGFISLMRRPFLSGVSINAP